MLFVTALRNFCVAVGCELKRLARVQNLLFAGSRIVAHWFLVKIQAVKQRFHSVHTSRSYNYMWDPCSLLVFTVLLLSTWEICTIFRCCNVCKANLQLAALEFAMGRRPQFPKTVGVLGSKVKTSSGQQLKGLKAAREDKSVAPGTQKLFAKKLKLILCLFWLKFVLDLQKLGILLEMYKNLYSLKCKRRLKMATYYSM